MLLAMFWIRYNTSCIRCTDQPIVNTHLALHAYPRLRRTQSNERHLKCLAEQTSTLDDSNGPQLDAEIADSRFLTSFNNIRHILQPRQYPESASNCTWDFDLRVNAHPQNITHPSRHQEHCQLRHCINLKKFPHHVQ